LGGSVSANGTLKPLSYTRLINAQLHFCQPFLIVKKQNKNLYPISDSLRVNSYSRLNKLYPTLDQSSLVSIPYSRLKSISFTAAQPHTVKTWELNHTVMKSGEGAGEQGGCSAESSRLPPMWPRFDSPFRHHMWAQFVLGSRPCPERFFSGCSCFPLSSKTNTSKFQLDLGGVPS